MKAHVMLNTLYIKHFSLKTKFDLFLGPQKSKMTSDDKISKWSDLKNVGGI